MAPVDYVSDYEDLKVKAKVVTASTPDAKPETTTVADTKDQKSE